ncbi:MAG: bifunctional metallophosphatase/5'-nucleotidase, partial [Bacteroidaceae bacterium]|nr:bifunctional metallophosphatase/5'-nucleotidase [Bacteroidaceae bacterium]
IVERSGKKIGIFGLSPNPDGLVLKDNYEGVGYRSPIETAREYSSKLRSEGCELVICLSHLGFNIPSRCSDEQLAAETSGIDIILGGHSHDLFEEPVIRKNNTGKDVVINHSGKYGRTVGLLSASIKAE